MSSVFGRRANIMAILIAAAIFFTALGFFVASDIDRPAGTMAAGLWQDGPGLTEEMAAVPSFVPVVEKVQPTVVHIFVTGKESTQDVVPTPGDPG